MIDKILESQPRLIVIGGMSRSGKSTLARNVALHLSNALILSIDNYLGGAGYRKVISRTKGFYPIEKEMELKFNYQQIVSDVGNLLSGEAVLISQYDRQKRIQLPHKLSLRLQAEQTLIVEGTPALAIDNLVSMKSLKIYLYASPEERKQALFKDWLDLKKLSLEQAEMLLSYRRSNEEPFIHSCRSQADILLFRKGATFSIDKIAVR